MSVEVVIAIPRAYVALGDPHDERAQSLKDLSPQKLIEVQHVFATYKLLEDKSVDVSGWADVDRAKELLVEDRARFEVQG